MSVSILLEVSRASAKVAPVVLVSYLCKKVPRLSFNITGSFLPINHTFTKRCSLVIMFYNGKECVCWLYGVKCLGILTGRHSCLSHGGRNQPTT